MLFSKDDLLMAGLKFFQTLKTCTGNAVSREEHTLLRGFLGSNKGRVWLKMVSVQVVPPQIIWYNM